MKKCLYTVFAIFMILNTYSKQALADMVNQCKLGIVNYKNYLTNNYSNTLQVYIQANKAIIYYPENIIFVGNVGIKQGNIILIADQVQLTQKQKQHQKLLRTIIAKGNIHYSNGVINLQGIKALYNLNTKETNVYHGNYQIVGRQGRGKAYIIKQRVENRYTILEDGSFTSCLPGDNSWNIIGSKIIYDRKEQEIKIWNARFKISNTLIFYSPYLYIPIGNRHYSGFSLPKIQYSYKNGFILSESYYLNLAPNYDITITPSYTSKHDIQLQTEFHYLMMLGKGLVQLNRLPKNNDYDLANTDNKNRWLFYWHHHGIINQVWRLDIDYTGISNLYYFNNQYPTYGNITNGSAVQKFYFSYVNKNWDATLSYKKFQIFNKDNKDIYYQAPQLNLTYYKYGIGPFDFKVFSQATKFININNIYPKTIRFHIEPILNLFFLNDWGSLNTEVKLMVTHYQQNNINIYNLKTNVNQHLKSSVNRILSQLKTNGQIMFERNINYNTNYIITLEPRFQYLYVPYNNQNNIGIYDTTIMQIDYSSLFRDRSYSGLDRIPSTNQLAEGITSRIYDGQRIERFNISVGHIYYFSPSSIYNFTNILNEPNNIGNFMWVGDSYWRITDKWGVRGSLQYNCKLNSITLSNAVLEYRQNENRTLQLNYRYISPKYIKQILFNMNHPSYQQGIAQFGMTGSWSLLNHWWLVGAYYYDTKTNQFVDQLVGLQYNTCCWAVNIGYEHKVIGWDNNNSVSQYDNKVSLNIELRGLTNNDSLDTVKMLTSNIIPFQRAF